MPGLAKPLALLLGVALLVSISPLVAGARAAVTESEAPIGGVPPSGAPTLGGGGVLVVGDSLEVLTAPYLRRYLRGQPLTINAEGGYNSYQIFDLFAESYRPSQSVIVFDAGTNDNPAYPQILAGNLSKVAETVGNRCIVVPTVHGFTVNGVNNDGKNRAVYDFASSRPGTQVPDWAGAVAARPQLLQPDGLHPTPEGADFRARLIAGAVSACLTPVSPLAAGPKPKRPRSVLASLVALFRTAVSPHLELARLAGGAVLEPMQPVASLFGPTR